MRTATSRSTRSTSDAVGELRDEAQPRTRSARTTRTRAGHPDGSRIAFERGIGTNVGDTTKEIWTMRADGSDRVQLTNNAVYDVQPAYSPDGTQIAYETKRGRGPRDIHAVGRRRAGRPTNVTNTGTAVTDEQPDWGWGGPGGPVPRPPRRATLADLDDPTLGVDVNVAARVRHGADRRGGGAAAGVAGIGLASQKGIRFVPLTRGASGPGGFVPRHTQGHGPAGERSTGAGRRQRGDFLSFAVPDPPVEGEARRA